MWKYVREMTPIALASTWQPRGEFSRLARLAATLKERYAGVYIVLPPKAEQALVETIEEDLGLNAVRAEDWTHGKHIALRQALNSDATHVHYCDLDRLLYWAEAYGEELRQTLNVLTVTDVLVMGRSEAAWGTHPQAMRLTEQMFNEVFSHLLGQPMDIGASSRGFSRRVAEFLVQHSTPGRAVGVDSEWLVLAHRAGFGIDYVAVDGLGWETPDQYKEDMIADVDLRLKMAADADTQWNFWLQRAKIGQQIIEAGLAALQMPIGVR